MSTVCTNLFKKKDIAIRQMHRSGRRSLPMIKRYTYLITGKHEETQRNMEGLWEACMNR